MREKVVVSVIVPIYNVEKYLEHCLQSICVQTYRDLQIICVDDGSTDSSGQILDEFAERDSRVEVIHKINEGYGKAVNVGLDMAKGKYIQIVESDDYILPDMLDTLLKVAEENQLDIVKADFYRFYEENELVRQGLCGTSAYYNKVWSAEESTEIFKAGLYTWAGIYRTDFLNENGIRHNETPGASYQDNGFWFQTIALARRVMFIDKAFYCLRRDNPNSSFFNTGKVRAMSVEYDFIKRFILDKLNGAKKYLELHNWFRLINYCFTANRIDLQYKEELHEIVTTDFRREEEEGNINWSLYSSSSSRLLKLILQNNIDWFYLTRYGVEKDKLDQICRAKAILLYGAGNVGQSIAARYQKEKFPVIGFAVSQKDGIGDEILGLPVKKIEDWESEWQHSLIQVTVGQKYRNEIVQKLESLSIYNYI